MTLNLTDFEAKLIEDSLAEMARFISMTSEMIAIPKDPPGSYMYMPSQRLMIHTLDVIDKLRKRVDLVRKQIEVSGLHFDTALAAPPVPHLVVEPAPQLGRIRDYGQLGNVAQPAVAKAAADGVPQDCIAVMDVSPAVQAKVTGVPTPDKRDALPVAESMPSPSKSKY